MDSLTDALQAGPRNRSNCNFGTWLNNLTEEDQKSVKKALLDPAWTTRDLHEVLKKFSFPCARDNLSRHRQGGCQICGPI